MRPWCGTRDATAGIGQLAHRILHVGTSGERGAVEQRQGGPTDGIRSSIEERDHPGDPSREISERAQPKAGVARLDPG